MSLMDVESVLDERIDPFDLDKYRHDYLTQCQRGSPSSIAIFSYACALIRSTKSDVREGIEMLERLLREQPDEVNKRDYVYYLALANARLRNYDRALAYLDILISAETHNRQAQELKDVIEKKMKKDGIVGAAILGGGAALIVGTVVAALFAGKR